MPNKGYSVLGLNFNLNPCEFNRKEHTMIVGGQTLSIGSDYDN